MKRTLMIFSIILIWLNISFAQWNFQSSLTTFYNDNIYRSPFKKSDFISGADIQIGYQWTKIPFSVSYAPEYIFYQTQTLQNFWLHQLSLDFYPYLDSNKKYRLYIGIEGDWRKNKEDFSLYDYTQFNLNAGLFMDFDFLFSTLTYRFRNRSYSQNPIYSNRTHFFNLKLNKSFPTRSTIIFNMKVGSRKYSGETFYYTVYDTVFIGGMGRMGRRNNFRTVPRQIEQNTPQVSLNQLQLSLRVAQSLLPNMGIYFQYSKSFDLSSTGYYQNQGSYFQDDELYDDPFSYLTDDWSSQLTWILPWQIKVKAGGSYADKRYVEENAYISSTDSLGSGDLRKDKKLTAFVSFEKTFRLPFNEGSQLQTYWNFYYIHNKSNSYWYEYSNLISGLGIGLVF
ncbi:MAG: hypothetical protein GXO77_06150 [Calditrichaeota bacterium]|nr:hypothetical protein [Calditrichota bacterium]